METDAKSPLQTPDTLSDEALVRLALADQGMFAYLIKRYEGKISRYIRRITTVSAEDVEDILQEVFIKVYVNLNGFNPDLKFSSWIYRIAHNQVVSHHRKRQASPHGHLIDLDERLVETLAADLDLGADIDRALLKERLGSALDAIDEKYREVLVLKFLEEKSYQEIADILKKPMGTIATLINKGKDRLRTALTAQSPSYAYGTD